MHKSLEALACPDNFSSFDLSDEITQNGGVSSSLFPFVKTAFDDESSKEQSILAKKSKDNDQSDTASGDDFSDFCLNHHLLPGDSVPRLKLLISQLITLINCRLPLLQHRPKLLSNNRLLHSKSNSRLSSNSWNNRQLFSNKFSSTKDNNSIKTPSIRLL